MAGYNNYNLNSLLLSSVSGRTLYYNSGQQAGKVRYTDTTSFSQIMAEKAGKSRSSSLFPEIPVSMNDIFDEAASKYGVDANLLKAIGKAESGFNASVVSPAGAMGVMQLMPATARSLGVSDPYDARQNIMGGASYIAKLLKMYDGDVKLALAAYNAGSGNVAKYGGIPPFKETQAYVKKIMEYVDEGVSVNAAAEESPGVELQMQDSDSIVMDVSSEYLSNMVDLMRIRLEMKLAGIFSQDEEREQLL